MLKHLHGKASFESANYGRVGVITLHETHTKTIHLLGHPLKAASKVTETGFKEGPRTYVVTPLAITASYQEPDPLALLA